MPTAPPLPAADAVCVGETMAVLGPSDDRPLAEQESVRLGTGGAESNVACALAGFGHRTAWLSRLGDDPFGRRIRAELTACGVDVDAVQTDPDRPTGVYFKDPGRAGTRTHYYRRGSAAAGMGPELARLPLLRRARLVHLSGITAALSDSCGQLLDALLLDRDPDAEGRAAGPVVSFDVNHRPALWRGGSGQAADRLLTLARAADLVFVGRDEAEGLWGTNRADDAAALLAPAPAVVVKDAEHGATSYVRGTRTYVPSLPTKVVEPVGAGDAFAAGYLSGALDGRDERARLRLGHLAAAAALRTRDDVPVVPAREETGRFLALDDEAWATLPRR
ncbi:sugar kinase [Streptomyces mayonensis]|uniref:sugar kinase n=1 Tax=Streptomyces mayonensis TaxID=2750816 RepID=UPI001C1DE3E5|nr:sugar kinase [Streptomyces sp. A108]MBU6535233.1 sugar kinase [Streptomyces sp. A108]